MRSCKSVIEEITEEYRQIGYSPYEINDDYCEDFAAAVIERTGGYQEDIYELSSENFTDDVLLLRPELIGGYGTFPSHIDPETFDMPAHVWVYCKGKHYDAEQTSGVADFFKLPIFRRAIERHGGVT